jgi:hypothetical protein
MENIMDKYHQEVYFLYDFAADCEYLYMDGCHF